MYMSSRMPIASAMKETMFAVSRTVSPWASWDLPSSRSWTVRPSRLQAEAKLKRVRVELSRNRETARPLANRRGERSACRRARRISATANTARSSPSDRSQVSRKSESSSPPPSSPAARSIRSAIARLSILFLLTARRPVPRAGLPGRPGRSPPQYPAAGTARPQSTSSSPIMFSAACRR